MSRLEDIDKQINELMLEKNKIVEEQHNEEVEKMTQVREEEYNKVLNAYNKYKELNDMAVDARNTYLDLKYKYNSKYGNFRTSLNNHIPNNQPEFWLDWLYKNC